LLLAFAFLCSYQMEQISCTSAPEFYAATSKLENDITESRSLVVLVFLGEKVESTGLSWCPDCTRAEPVISKELNDFWLDQQTKADGYQKIVVVTCTVSRSELRSTDFVLKTDPAIQLGCVPTLLVPAAGGTVKGRLGDAECQSASTVAAFLTSVC
jgi:hypothetical protein